VCVCVCVCLYIYIYTHTHTPTHTHSIPPDDGLQICPKLVEVDWRNELRTNSASSWFYLHGRFCYCVSILPGGTAKNKANFIPEMRSVAPGPKLGTRRIRRSIDHATTTLGCSLFWVFTQRGLAVSYRLSGTTYRSHLQGSSLTLNIGPIGCS
jgi:hypothetical protein